MTRRCTVSFTVPRAALELNNALNAKVPAARSAGGKRKA